MNSSGAPFFAASSVQTLRWSGPTQTRGRGVSSRDRSPLRTTDRCGAEPGHMPRPHKSLSKRQLRQHSGEIIDSLPRLLREDFLFQA
uniref:Uncharacterized protein n=1 Tax=Knipowitschia caucasica TaxID=637954 RepID=A0AAV2K3P8_KNICA